MPFSRLLTSLCLLLMTVAAPARAELRALLIGVSNYDPAIGLADLSGPANDVRLMIDVLTGRGVRDMTVLADGVAGAGYPDLATILAELDGLAKRSGPGDLVYVQFSGHGTRQPDMNGDETDGMDEVFMPVDTRAAERGTGIFPNALTDDALGEAVAAIRAGGADVWLVIDACNSSTGLRGNNDRVRVRTGDAAALGTPVLRGGGSDAGGAIDLAKGQKGDVVALYASRSDERAQEIAIDGPDGPVWYGLLTLKLAARLQAATGESYRQLFQSVMADMNATDVPGAARMQTPVWEGTMLDRPVLGDGAGLPRRYAVTGDRVALGKVQGGADGAVVALFAAPGDPDEMALGQAQMVDVTLLAGRLVAVGPDCVPQVGAPCVAAGALPADARFAAIRSRPLDPVVGIAPPRDAAGAELAADDPVMQALMAALDRINAVQGERVRLARERYQAETFWDGQALWIGARARIGEAPAGARWMPDDGPEALTDILDRMARAEVLVRYLAQAQAEVSFLSINPVGVSLSYAASDVTKLTALDQPVDPYEECTAAEGDGSQPLPPAAVLKQCDSVTLSAIGTVDGQRDVNRIRIDPRYCIETEYARIEGARASADLGWPMHLCSDCPDGPAAGEDRMFVLVTEAQLNSEPLDLAGVFDSCTGSQAAQRGAGDRALQYLQALARTGKRRGVFGTGEMWIDAFQWTVLPRSEAFRRAGRCDAGGVCD